MSSISKIILTMPETAAQMKDELGNPETTSGARMYRVLGKLFGQKLQSGIRYINSMSVAWGAVQASATLSFSGQPTSGDTFIISGITFTAGNSGTNKFAIGASLPVTMTNFITVYQALSSAKIAGVSVASDGASVLTFMVNEAGITGNGCTCSCTSSTCAASDFANGSEGTIVSFS